MVCHNVCLIDMIRGNGVDFGWIGNPKHKVNKLEKLRQLFFVVNKREPDSKLWLDFVDWKGRQTKKQIFKLPYM